MPQHDQLVPDELVRLLETAVEQAKEAVLITSAQLDAPGPEILFVNPALCEMTGYQLEEILHKNPRILQGPKSDRAMLKRLREALDRGEPFSGETVNYRKDGGEYYVEWDITPIRSAAGEITHYLSIQRNVTARKLAEMKMQELLRQVEKSRSDLNSILDEIRIGAVMADSEERVVFLNAEARRLLGETARTSWRELFALDGENAKHLETLLEIRDAERNRIPLQLDRGGKRIRLEVDVKHVRVIRAEKSFFCTMSRRSTICAACSMIGAVFKI